MMADSMVDRMIAAICQWTEPALLPNIGIDRRWSGCCIRAHCAQELESLIESGLVTCIVDNHHHHYHHYHRIHH
jgi:hypothetical protein